jgi:hypothetical protein
MLGDRSDRSRPDRKYAPVWAARHPPARKSCPVAKNCAAGVSFAAAKGYAAAKCVVAMSRVAELLDVEPPDQ